MDSHAWASIVDISFCDAIHDPLYNLAHDHGSIAIKSASKLHTRILVMISTHRVSFQIPRSRPKRSGDLRDTGSMPGDLLVYLPEYSLSGQLQISCFQEPEDVSTACQLVSGEPPLQGRREPGKLVRVDRRHLDWVGKNERRRPICLCPISCREQTSLGK